MRLCLSAATPTIKNCDEQKRCCLRIHKQLVLPAKEDPPEEGVHVLGQQQIELLFSRSFWLPSCCRRAWCCSSCCSSIQEEVFDHKCKCGGECKLLPSIGGLLEQSLLFVQVLLVLQEHFLVSCHTTACPTPSPPACGPWALGSPSTLSRRNCILLLPWTACARCLWWCCFVILVDSNCLRYLLGNEEGRHHQELLHFVCSYCIGLGCKAASDDE